MVTEVAIGLTVALVVFLVVFLGGAALARLLGSTFDQASADGRGVRIRIRDLVQRELVGHAVVWLGGRVLLLVTPATLERLGDASRLCQDLFLRRSIDSKAWIGGRWLLFMALAGILAVLLLMGHNSSRALVQALAGLTIFGLLLAIVLPQLLLADLRALLSATGNGFWFGSLASLTSGQSGSSRVSRWALPLFRRRHSSPTPLQSLFNSG